MLVYIEQWMAFDQCGKYYFVSVKGKQKNQLNFVYDRKKWQHGVFMPPLKQ